MVKIVVEEDMQRSIHGIMLALLLVGMLIVFNTQPVKSRTNATVSCIYDTSPEVLYGTSGYPIGLITIDMMTGAGSLVGPTGTSYCVWGLEFDAMRDTLYGVVNDIIDVFGNSQLLRIDRATGAATPIGGLVGSRVDGLAYDLVNDRLYGADNYRNLVAIDTSTGIGTIVGYTGFPNLQGLAFNPLDGRLYGVDIFGEDPKLIWIDPLTGVGTAVASISTNWADIRGLAFDRSGTLYGAWQDGGNTARLVTINTSTGQISEIGPIGYPGVQGLAFVYPVSKSVHNINTGLDYSMIQQAIDAPETLDGHTIVVDAGTYMENVRINKRLDIVSRDGPSVTTVNASRNSTQDIFRLNAVNGVSISGFTLTGTTANAIYLFKANNTRISNNNASNCSVGIFLESSSNSTIVSNTANSNSGAGIYLNSSSSNTISENDVKTNYIGILVRANSANNTLRRNNATGNSRYGLYLFASSGNNLTENNSTGNIRDGIVLDNSAKNNLIANNIMQNSRYGIVCINSSNNKIYHNNLVNNTIQVYDMSWNSSSYSPSINLWDNGYPSGGNYWNNYPRTELCYDDGYRDTTWFANPGGIAAVRFTPSMAGIISQCSFYLWKEPSVWDDSWFKVHVLDASMQDMITPFFGVLEYETWYVVDLIKYGITVSTDFYIGIEWTEINTPYLFADTSSPDNRSWYNLNGTWTQWNTGDYMIRATVGTGTDNNGDGIGDTPYTIDANNQDRFPLMIPWITRVQDVAITDLTSYKTVVWQALPMASWPGGCTTFNATLANQGDYTETFNITVYANTTAVGTQEITLTSRNSTTVTFTWNASSFSRGNYTINAYVWPLREESDSADNNKTDGWVIVTSVGDIIGMGGYPDGRCNMIDIGMVAANFNRNMPPASTNCDVTGLILGLPDGRIDMRDVSLVASNFGISSQ